MPTTAAVCLPATLGPHAAASERFSETLRNRNNARTGKALPTITIHNQPPCSYTALATEEPKAPPMKMLVMYKAFKRLRLLASRAYTARCPSTIFICTQKYAMLHCQISTTTLVTSHAEGNQLHSFQHWQAVNRQQS